MDMGGAKLKAIKKVSKKSPDVKKVGMTHLWLVGGIVAVMSIIVAIGTW